MSNREFRKLDERIEALTNAFNELNDSLQKYFAEISDGLGAVKKLPTMMGQLQETVSGQFSNLFEHHMKAEFASRRASIEAASAEAEELEAFMERKQEALETDTDRVRRRYLDLLEDLAQETERRVRSLDSHAFRIVEDVYPQQVQERFSRLSVPAVERIAEEAERSANDRNLELEERWQQAERSIQEYLQETRKWSTTVRSRITDDEEDAEARSLRLRLLAVEVEGTEDQEPTLELAVLHDDELVPMSELPMSLADKIRAAAREQLEGADRTEMAADRTEALAEAVADQDVPRRRWWTLVENPPKWLMPNESEDR